MGSITLGFTKGWTGGRHVDADPGPAQALARFTQTIKTDKGELVLSGFDATTGKVSYTYRANVLTHTGGADLHDDFALTVKDANGKTGLTPCAWPSRTRRPVAGPNSIGDGRRGAQHRDRQRADRRGRGHGLPGRHAERGLGQWHGRLGPTTINGLYGKLVIQADGSYTYELNNSLLAVNQLNAGDKLVDTFNYVAKDTDGSTATSKLDITINGRTDALPVVTTPVAGTGNDLVLQEGTTSSTQGLRSRRKPAWPRSPWASPTTDSTATLTLTLAQLKALSASSTQTIKTDKGDLVLSGYNATTGVVSYTYGQCAGPHGWRQPAGQLPADGEGRHQPDRQRHPARGHHGHDAHGSAGHQLITEDGAQHRDGQRADRRGRGHGFPGRRAERGSVNGTAVSGPTTINGLYGAGDQADGSTPMS